MNQDRLEEFVPESLRSVPHASAPPVAKGPEIPRAVKSSDSDLDTRVVVVFVALVAFAVLFFLMSQFKESVAIFILLGYIAVSTVVYFIPSACASRRKNRNTASIFFLNLFLGWTLVGWVVALVWALYVEPPKK